MIKEACKGLGSRFERGEKQKALISEHNTKLMCRVNNKFRHKICYFLEPLKIIWNFCRNQIVSATRITGKKSPVCVSNMTTKECWRGYVTCKIGNQFWPRLNIVENIPKKSYLDPNTISIIYSNSSFLSELHRNTNHPVFCH